MPRVLGRCCERNGQGAEQNHKAKHGVPPDQSVGVLYLVRFHLYDQDHVTHPRPGFLQGPNAGASSRPEAFPYRRSGAISLPCTRGPDCSRSSKSRERAAPLFLHIAGPGMMLAEASVWSSAYHCDAQGARRCRSRGDPPTLVPRRNDTPIPNCLNAIAKGSRTCPSGRTF